MIYKVSAKFKKEKKNAFFEKLSDGTIKSQKPDGEEIVSSMKRAKITAPGLIEWYETCYCSTPLLHERTTVYDFYLSDIKTKLVDDYGEIQGNAFWSSRKGK